MIARDKFIDVVRRCVGTPVVHMGRKPGRALDCVGLPWAACNALGMGLPETRTYDSMPSAADLADGLARYCDMVPQDGHLWQVYVGREARHIVVPVGVNGCGQTLVVHAWGVGKRVCETVHTKRKIAAQWRIRGVC